MPNQIPFIVGETEFKFIIGQTSFGFLVYSSIPPAKAVCRYGDISVGHSCFPSRPNNGGSPNVFINGIKAHIQFDHWLTHCCVNPPFPCHDGFLSTGSTTVFVNGVQLGRAGDPISCGDTVSGGSPNVFAGG